MAVRLSLGQTYCTVPVAVVCKLPATRTVPRALLSWPMPNAPPPHVCVNLCSVGRMLLPHSLCMSTAHALLRHEPARNGDWARWHNPRHPSSHSLVSIAACMNFGRMNHTKEGKIIYGTGADCTGAVATALLTSGRCRGWLWYRRSS
jgi:hypothetical protein